MEALIRHEGIIKNISENMIYVSVMQNAACSECHVKSACSLSEGKERIIRIPNSDHMYKEGEKVIVTIRSSLGLKAVGYAFALPLLLLFITLFICLNLFQNESLAALISILALAIYYGILYLFRNHLEKKFIFGLKKIT